MGGTLHNNSGFTLVEIITSIVIMAIIGVIAGVGLSKIATGYVLSKKNTEIAQHGQIAITRLRKEFRAIKSISNGAVSTLTYKRLNQTVTQDVSICWSGTESSPLLLKMNAVDCTGGDILIDKVKLFRLNYCGTSSCSGSYLPGTTSIIEVTLELIGYDNTRIIIAGPDRVVLSPGDEG
ncbi:MAG: type II secretion system protein [Syntrophales bacterium]